MRWKQLFAKLLPTENITESYIAAAVGAIILLSLLWMYFISLPSQGFILLFGTLVALTMLYVFIRLSHLVFRKYKISFPPLAPLIYMFINYVVVIFFFSFIYWFVNESNHEAFHFPEGTDSGIFDFLYFSLISVATVGYGDIYPQSTLARLLVGVETMVGIFFISVLVANVAGKQQHEGGKTL